MVSKNVIETIFGRSHKFEIVKNPGSFFSDASWDIYRDGEHFRGPFSRLDEAVARAKEEG